MGKDVDHPKPLRKKMSHFCCHRVPHLALVRGIRLLPQTKCKRHRQGTKQVLTRKMEDVCQNVGPRSSSHFGGGGGDNVLVDGDGLCGRCLHHVLVGRRTALEESNPPPGRVKRPDPVVQRWVDVGEEIPDCGYSSLAWAALLDRTREGCIAERLVDCWSAKESETVVKQNMDQVHSP